VFVLVALSQINSLLKYKETRVNDFWLNCGDDYIKEKQNKQSPKGGAICSNNKAKGELFWRPPMSSCKELWHLTVKLKQLTKMFRQETKRLAVIKSALNY
jgi:hypothetical protein